jgi:hypothetical protein
MHPNSESQEPGRFARQLFVQSRTPLPTWFQSVLGPTRHCLWFSSSVSRDETGRVVGAMACAYQTSATPDLPRCPADVTSALNAESFRLTTRCPSFNV